MNVSIYDPIAGTATDDPDLPNHDVFTLRGQEKKLLACTFFDFELHIYFNPDKAGITQEDLQPGTYENTVAELNEVRGVLNTANFVYENILGEENKTNMTNRNLIFNGETDAAPSGYEGGNPKLADDRARNLKGALNVSNNASYRKVNHSGEVRDSDRNATTINAR